MIEDEKDILSQEKKLFNQLVSKALKQEESKFEFIKSLNELFVVNNYISGVKKVVKMFKNLQLELQKQYLTEIKTDATDMTTLVNLVRFKRCKEFYEAEIELAKDMKKEYRAYVFGGHVFRTLLGIQRAEKDLVDYRKVPWGFFK